MFKPGGNFGYEMAEASKVSGAPNFEVGIQRSHSGLEDQLIDARPRR